MCTVLLWPHFGLFASVFATMPDFQPSQVTARKWHLSLKTTVARTCSQFAASTKLLSMIVILRHCAMFQAAWKHGHEKKNKSKSPCAPFFFDHTLVSSHQSLQPCRTSNQVKLQQESGISVWKLRLLAHAVKGLHRQNYSPWLSSCAIVPCLIKLPNTVAEFPASVRHSKNDPQKKRTTDQHSS